MWVEGVRINVRRKFVSMKTSVQGILTHGEWRFSVGRMG